MKATIKFENDIPEFDITIADACYPDDAIKEAEAIVSKITGHDCHYSIDFTIENFPEICDWLLPF